MNKAVYRFFQCMILLGLAAYLAEKWVSGRLSYYINPRFAILTLIGMAGLALMALIGLELLFSGEQPSDPQNEPRPPKRKANLALVFLFPIITALLGLSTPVILTMYAFVFIIGLVRVIQSTHTGPSGHRQPADIPGTALLFLIIPLMLGVVVPARPLSTASLSTRGMNLSAPSSIGQQSIQTMEIAPDDRTVLDWIKIFNYEEDLSAYIGKPANVIGFVYHDPQLKTGQFMVGRFAVTCCVADAFAIGMVVDWPEGASLADNSWVNVKGTVDVLTLKGQRVPVIHAETVNSIQAPEQPYLYP